MLCNYSAIHRMLYLNNSECRITENATFALFYVSVICVCVYFYGRLGGLKVSVLHSLLSDRSSSILPEALRWFLGKTLYSHSASLHPGVQV